MSIRRTHLALQVTALLCAAGAVAAVLAGLMLPLSVPESAVQPRIAAVAKGRDLQVPALSTFAPLFGRSLQPSSPAQSTSAAPLEAATATLTAAAPAVSSSQLSLVGTIGDSIALIKGPDGTMGIVEVGDDVNGSAVLAIRPSQCDLRVNGKLTTLRMPPPPDDSAVVRAP